MKENCSGKRRNTKVDAVVFFGKIHIQIKIITECISKKFSVIVVRKCDRGCVGVNLIGIFWRGFCDENSTSCSKWTCFQR
jgi:hypothetical protein